MSTRPAADDRFATLTFKDLQRLLKQGRTTMYKLTHEDDFPRAIVLSKGNL